MANDWEFAGCDEGYRVISGGCGYDTQTTSLVLSCPANEDGLSDTRACAWKPSDQLAQGVGDVSEVILMP